MSCALKPGWWISILAATACAVVWALSLRGKVAPPAQAYATAIPTAPAAAQSSASERVIGPAPVSASPRLEAREGWRQPTDARPSITLDQRKALLRDAYRDLLVNLNLDESQTDQFVLLAASAREARLSRELRTGGEAGEPSDESPRTISDAILSLLGYERFQQYESFESAFESRSQLRGFETELRAAGLSSLNEAQRNDLLNILIEERALMPQTARVDPDRCPPEHREALAIYYDRIEQRAEFKLPSQQYSVFAFRVERDRQSLIARFP